MESLLLYGSDDEYENEDENENESVDKFKNTKANGSDGDNSHKTESKETLKPWNKESTILSPLPLPSPSFSPPCLPPLSSLPSPDEILELFNENGHVFFNSTKNNLKKIRTVPHVEGNFATHIYIPILIPNQLKNKMLKILLKCTSQMTCLAPVDLLSTRSTAVEFGDSKPNESIPSIPSIQSIPSIPSIQSMMHLDDEFHISLSRTVYLRLHQIQPFLHLLQNKFKKLAQKRLELDFCKWQEFVNDEGTRTFLSLEITKKGKSEILQMIDIINDVFEIYNFPTFYEDARPHISFLWCPGNKQVQVAKIACGLNSNSTAFPNDNDSKKRKLHDNDDAPKGCALWTSQVTKITCKVGQRVHQIWKV